MKKKRAKIKSDTGRHAVPHSPRVPKPNIFHSLLTKVNAPSLIKADSQHPHPNHRNVLVQAGLDIRLNIKVFHKIWDIVVVIVLRFVLSRSLLALLNGLVRLGQLA